MSINIDSPNDDISTSAGDAPTLGGGAPSVNVMSTTAATATQYAKLATLSFPATNNVAANLNFILTPKSTSGSYQPVIVSATALQATTGLSTSSKINILSTDGLSVSHNDLFLVTSAATNGTDIELHMQSIIAAVYDVQLLSYTLDTGISLSWNDGATWSATDPTAAAAVSVTSAWAGSGSWTPTIIGLTTAGTGTYTVQSGYYQESNSLVILTGRVAWIAHTGTGNMAIDAFPFVSGTGNQSAGQAMHQSITGTGDLAIYVGSSLNYGALYAVSLGSAWTQIPMDVSGDIIFTITYRKA